MSDYDNAPTDPAHGGKMWWDPADIIKALRSIATGEGPHEATLLNAATVIATNERIITELLRTNARLHLRIEALEEQLVEAAKNKTGL